MKTKVQAIRYHDISCGHRVVGQGGKCEHLHGHNYRIHFHCSSVDSARSVDSVGRVIDFSVIKSILCEWLEVNWDHKMLLWEKDSMLEGIIKIDPTVVSVPFNPTAENMAGYLLTEICPYLLENMDVRVEKVIVEETRKCSASVEFNSCL